MGEATQVAAIAAGLTKAQREQFITDRWNDWETFEPFVAACLVIAELDDVLGLTPLGEQVRAHLMQERP